MRPPSPNQISQGQHGISKAVDYRSSPDVYIYAPEDLTFVSYGQQGVKGTTNDAGLALRAKGAHGLHQFAHTEETYFKSGTVKKGARIAKMGHTGYTIPSGPGGRHLHFWVQTPNGYVYPPNLINEPFGGSSAPAQGGDMFQNEAEVQQAYQLLRGKNGTAAEAKAWVGQPKQRFFQVGKAEADAGRTERDALKAEVARLKANPPTSGATPEQILGGQIVALIKQAK